MEEFQLEEMSCADESSAFLDFLLDKDCKEVIDSHDTPWFSSGKLKNSVKSESLSTSKLSIKDECEDLCVEELLGHCFDASEFIPIEAKQSPSSDIDLKEENLDDLVGLPFDSVMESFDDNCFDSSSDSGVSADSTNDQLYSPSSLTADSSSGDLLGDNQDWKSDVSDLGSMVSANELTNSASELNNISATNMLQQFQTTNSLLSRQIILPSSASYLMNNTAVSHSTTTPLPTAICIPNSSLKIAPLCSSTLSLPAPTRTIKLDLSQGKSTLGANKVIPLRPAVSVAAPKIVNNISKTSVLPIISKTPQSLASTANKPSIVNSNGPSTFVVNNQTSKVPNPLLKGGFVLRTQNGKPILSPVNVKDLNKVRTVKIINPNVNLRAPNTSQSGSTKPTTFYTAKTGSDNGPIFKVTPTAFVTPSRHGREPLRIGSASRVINESALHDDDDDDDDDVDVECDVEAPRLNQRLILTDEERKLMRKEGLVLPTRYPLTKQEERDLKRIRRKIRNKISAQDSRKRKKEYMDDLEERVHKYAVENKDLHCKIEKLEKQNSNLLIQLKKFQNSASSNRNQHQNASTALMMLILSAALIVVPSFRPQNSRNQSDFVSSSVNIPTPGRTRSLLEAKSTPLDLEAPIDEFSEIKEDFTLNNALNMSPPLSDHDYSPSSKKRRLDTNLEQNLQSVDNESFLWKSGKPPDDSNPHSNGLSTILEFLRQMINPLSKNWTDSGGSCSDMARLSSGPTLKMGSSSSVILKMDESRLQDIELE